MAQIEIKLNVVGECSHQFKKDNMPYGATMIYLLSESHLSIQTFVDEGKITLDLFNCIFLSLPSLRLILLVD
jgi:S-adenosylmethionine/arginine decarboxylase-like enzyme